MSAENMHVHSFKTDVIPSTCKENGYTVYRCECGYEHKDNFKPLGHLWGDWKTQSFATCTEEGLQIRFCGRCGKKEERIISATGHRFTLCENSRIEKGMVEYFCENCGEIVVQPSASTNAKKKTTSRKGLIIAITTAVAVACVILGFMLSPAYDYFKVKKYIENGDYYKAYVTLYGIRDYKDSAELLKDFTVRVGKTKIISYDKDGKVNDEAVLKNEYDENGICISGIGYYADGSIYSELVYDKKEGVMVDVRYNKNGSIGNRVGFYEDGQQVKFLDIYDENGNKQKRVEYYEDGGMKLSVSYVENGNENYRSEYNENGDQTLEYYNESYGEDLIRYSYEYDEKGNVISTTAYNSDSYLFNYRYTYENKYDENDRLIVKTEYIKYTEYGEDEFSRKYEYKYDEKGNLIYEVVYNEDGDESSRLEREYDESGNLIYEIIYTDKKKFLEKEWKYDEIDNLLYESNIQYGNAYKIETKTEREYDKNGFIIYMKTTIYTSEEELCTEYEYSDHIVFYTPNKNK